MKHNTVSFMLPIVLIFAACSDTIEVPGPQGMPGEQGIPGPQGATGKQGPVGPPGLALGAFYQGTVTGQTPMDGGFAEAVAYCNEGDTFVSGSCRFGKTPTDQMTPFDIGVEVEMDGDEPVPVGWRCSGFVADTSYVESRVLCAEAE